MAGYIQSIAAYIASLDENDVAEKKYQAANAVLESAVDDYKLVFADREVKQTPENQLTAYAESMGAGAKILLERTKEEIDKADLGLATKGNSKEDLYDALLNKGRTTAPDPETEQKRKARAYREMFMLQAILKARNSGYMMAGIGDNHLLDLRPHLGGIPNWSLAEFKASEKDAKGKS